MPLSYLHSESPAPQRPTSQGRSLLVPRLLACGLLASLLPACGGGGGSSPKAKLQGLISVLVISDSILEAEPNDSVEQAHLLGDFSAGTSLTVLGHTSDVVDADPFDIFRINAVERLAFTVTMDFEDPGANDFDMYVWDPVAQQFVEFFYATSVPEIGTFHAKGSFLLAVQSFAGSGNYSLEVSAEQPADPIAERESNDEPGQGQYLGEMLSGDSLSLSGAVDKSTDESDFSILTLPGAATLDLSLAFGAGADFDLYLYDGSTDLEHPALITSFISTDNPETGSVNLGAMTTLVLEVRAFTGAGSYTLDIVAPEAGALTQGPGSGIAGANFNNPELAYSNQQAMIGRRPAPLVNTLRRLRRAPSAQSLFGALHFEAVHGQVLVRPAAGHAAEHCLKRMACREELRTPGGARKLSFEIPGHYTAEERARMTLALAYCLDARPELEYAEVNGIWRAFDTTPTDELYNLQWHYPQIQLPTAWDTTQGSNGIIVAVIDTGQKNHPDLAGRQRNDGHDLISDISMSGDGDGPDADQTDEGDHSSPSGSSFHGTHVAGTIGARTGGSGAGSGVAGVNWQGKIMHVRVLGEGGGTNFDIANGILYAAQLANSSGALPNARAHVLNMSLGGPSSSATVQNAIDDARAAGSVVVAAAGNEASSQPSYPAANNGVISVAAVDLAGNQAPYSNFHATVDLAAPGGDLSADLNGDGYGDGVLSTAANDDGDYFYAFNNGTSMAAPHVAGLAALLLAVDDSLSPDQVENLMTSTATDLGAAGHDVKYGHGLINAAGAIAQASGGAGSDPLVGLATQTVALGLGLNELDVPVFNLGAGTLLISGTAQSTQDGGDWLSTALLESASASSDTSAIRVLVSRNGLADGAYQGIVDMFSNDPFTPTISIQVSMSVDSSPVIEDVNIYVLAVDPISFETIYEDVVNPNFDLAYDLRGLPPGDYLIIAGSDDNDDGFICGEGDSYCGAYPSMDQPVILTVEKGQVLQTLDFSLGSGGVSTAGVGGEQRGFRRMQ